MTELQRGVLCVALASRHGERSGLVTAQSNDSTTLGTSLKARSNFFLSVSCK